MIGAIAGDMIGSPYEGYPIKHKDFELLVSAFTDDTVLTSVMICKEPPTRLDHNTGLTSLAKVPYRNPS